jgi:hypothetical protein
MRYFIIALASCLMAACGPVMASETTDQIKRACQIKENMDHPVCVKRAERAHKASLKRAEREQQQLDSILGRDPGAKSTH